MPTLDFLKDQADWGEFVTRNVDPRAPNNVTTRARRQRAMADRESYEVAKEESDAADLEGLAMRDKDVRAYVFGRERLDMARRAQDAKLRAESELLPLRQNALIAQQRSATALERARTQAADFKAKMDEQEHNDTTGFTQFILSSGARRGTPEFANVVAEARMKFPAIPTVLFDDTWKMTGSSRTPEEVQASLAAARAANPNATITATEKGTTITDRPAKAVTAKPMAEQANLALVKAIDKELLEKEDAWRTAKAEKPNEAPSVERDISALRKQREQLLSGQGAAPAQSRPALNDIFK